MTFRVATFSVERFPGGEFPSPVDARSPKPRDAGRFAGSGEGMPKTLGQRRMSTPPAAIGAFEKDCPSRSARPSKDSALGLPSPIRRARPPSRGGCSRDRPDDMEPRRSSYLGLEHRAELAGADYADLNRSRLSQRGEFGRYTHVRPSSVRSVV